jgi:hypothetical protein
MKTIISILPVLILTAIIGFSIAPENSNASEDNISACCTGGFSIPGAVINAYYNGTFISSTITQADSTFCFGTGPNPVTLTSTFNGATFVVKNVQPCAKNVRFYAIDN